MFVTRCFALRAIDVSYRGAINEGWRSMRKPAVLVLGVALGFVAAHFVNQNPGGRRFFERVNRGGEELVRAFTSGYHAAESEQLDEDLERELNNLDGK